MTLTCKTRFLIISDTHGHSLPPSLTPSQPFDVVVHCGDLTQHSKISEFHAALGLLRGLNAPLKLVIAGNHDFSLDQAAFASKIREFERISGDKTLEPDLISKEYGQGIYTTYPEVRKLLDDAKSDGIIFLDEGTYTFNLVNGSRLKVYASPYTPSTDAWGFNYANDHTFDIEAGTDMVITHGPPRGIMDVAADKRRVGCPQLFAAVARARPQVHCFGHVHGGWGARRACWRPNISEAPSHFADIDHGRSRVIATLAKKLEGPALERCREQRYCEALVPEDGAEVEGDSTLFVNASLEEDGDLTQFPWLVTLDLPAATVSS